MTDEPLIVSPGFDDRTARMPDGVTRPVPDGWVLVPPGDAVLTRRLKSTGPCWLVQQQKGRRTLSRGLFADGARVTAIRQDLEVERSNPAHEKKQQAARARRERAQEAYVGEFADAVRTFLDFPLQHHELAEQLATRIAAHATPVGSGTVARTQRIPIERRAEAAVIAWLRHQTTAYDRMHIARVKGRRREVRRMLAERSRELLDGYRRGEPAPVGCPLQQALTASARQPAIREQNA